VSSTELVDTRWIFSSIQRFYTVWAGFRRARKKIKLERKFSSDAADVAAADYNSRLFLFREAV
jgi:hypothetical protein